ncbi:hypothetical protein VYU27_001312 [Nannochloropsis oceanica]
MVDMLSVSLCLRPGHHSLWHLSLWLGKGDVLSTSFLILAGLVLGVWLLCEIVFYFYLRYIVLPELNRLTTPEDSVHTPWDEFHKIIDVVSQLKGSYAFEQFFSGWFLGSPIQDIRRGNVREMLAWALYSTAQSALTVRQKACVEDVLYWLKMRFQIDCPEGYNPKVRPMLLTLDPVKYNHRPLLFYAVLTVIQVLGHGVLMLLGFTRHEVNGIAYWYRSRVKDVPAGEQASLPMIFFHGISPGLNLYLLVIHILSKGRKVVLMEVPHIAMCLNFKAKRLGDMVKTVEIIAKRHRMPHFAVAGHSFGSLCAAWVTKHLKHNVRQLILLDPVSLLLGLPDVCYNFLHKRPRTIMEYILHYGGSTEITIHHTLRRQFWWYEGQLFLDAIKCPVFIGLSGNDEIVPSPVLKVYIEDHLKKIHAEEHQRYQARSKCSNSSSNDSTSAQRQCSLSSSGTGNGNHYSNHGSISNDNLPKSSHSSSNDGKGYNSSSSGSSSSRSSSSSSRSSSGGPSEKAVVSFELTASERAKSTNGGCSGECGAAAGATASCYLGDKRGCVLERVQYSYWEGWSHGEILFRFPQLKALDVAMREQEKLFRSPEVTVAMEASTKAPSRQSSLK